MTERKNWGETVMGWFIVRDEAGEPAPGELAPEAAELPAAPAIEFATAPPPATDGNVDFKGVFDAAGIGSDEQARVERAAELLATLPAETTPAIKKQIVEASLKAFGVPVDGIIEAGAREIQALEGYIQTGARDAQQVLADGARRIAELEQEMERVRTVMTERTSEQQAVVTACNQKKLGIQSVLEFFGREAVARVVRESPKLIDPSAGKA